MGTSQRYEKVKGDLEAACAQADRSASAVTLIAVSKTVGPDEVARAIEVGARDFGENRPDQLMEKADAYPEVNWHFIGNIQSRRIKDIVGRATLIHSLFEERHARKISDTALQMGIVQDVLLEVNVSGEQTKSGLAPTEVESMLATCEELPGIRVRGLMTMAPRADEEAVRKTFSGLAALLAELRSGQPEASASDFCELSMGMSEDWSIAVELGATYVRIGRAIFSEEF